MWKQGATLFAAVALAGCGAMNTDTSRMTAQAPTDAELAAYAGGHKYPATQPAKDDLKAAAIVDRQREVIKIYNFGNRPIESGDVWVNQSFVQHLTGVAPGAAPRVIRFSDLYNGMGQQFSKQNEQVRTVQVQSDGNLYTLQGPGAE